ncbi:MAG TPA: type 1 glutamine amidotransferase [Actinomycetota bacterium]
MKPILLVRNDAFETFGIAPATFAEAGVPVRVLEAIDPEAPRISLDDVSGVVVFGSSSNVEHANEQPFIKELRELTLEALDRDLPYLGVCFGAQVLAWSLDCPVMKAPVREVGFEPLRIEPAAGHDPVLSHYRDGDMVFQWHMDTFELPDQAHLLATGDGVRNQAYRLGERTWGVQFHFEIDGPEIELWLKEFALLGDLLEEWGKTSDQVWEETRRHLTAHEAKGREVFRRFADVAREAAR